jgi:hypothetical protein
MPVHEDDLVLHLRIVYSRRFIDQFESQITSQIKLLRASNAPGFDEKMWSREVRQSLRYAFFLETWGRNLGTDGTLSQTLRLPARNSSRKLSVCPRISGRNIR